jgi:hypothetical protein
MSAERQKMIEERRKGLTMEERQVEAIERIADSLAFIQGEIVGIRHAVSRPAPAFQARR